MSTKLSTLISSPEDIKLRENDIISGDFGSYQIKKLVGAGTYARVARCIDMSTNKEVAIKFARVRLARVTKHEANILQLLRGNKKVVKFIKSFQYKGNYCMVLEPLDRSLFDLLLERKNEPLHICEIRYIAEQQLEALKDVHKSGLIHADLKPDNVMLVDHEREPYKIKLIDFGMTSRASTFIPGSLIQAVGYRAPEVSLGLPITKAIDMWALGCVLAYLYLGDNLYPYHCEYEMIRLITQLQGIPVNLLRQGQFTRIFYKDCQKDGDDMFELLTKSEYEEKTGKKSKPFRNISCKYRSLEELILSRKAPRTPGEEEDIRQFLNLLEQLLEVDAEKRVSAANALKHPFITKKTTSKTSLTKYLKSLNLRTPHNENGDYTRAESTSFRLTNREGSKLKKQQGRETSANLKNAKGNNIRSKLPKIFNTIPKHMKNNTGSGSSKLSRPSKYETTLAYNSSKHSKCTKTASDHQTCPGINTVSGSSISRAMVVIGTFLGKIFRSLTCFPVINE